MYKKFEDKIKYTFKNKDYLKRAFTHSSFAYENRLGVFANNEKLEFLGDAVLELAISDYLFRIYDEISEGELTKLRASVVCEPTLARNARDLNIGEYLFLGKGEEQTGGRERDSILADTFEAVTGAIYLDSCFEEAQKFILSALSDDIKIFKNNYMNIDYKTNLQEYYQKFSEHPLKYNIVSEEGPDHDKTFTAEVSYNGKILGTGKGKSKKEAEQKAALVAIQKNKIK